MAILHANCFGEGPNLIILHGFLGTGDNWKTLGKAYAEKGFKVHLLDQRNHGKSFHNPNFTYTDMAADLGHYMAHNHIEQAHLLGHSMGGKTAMQFGVTNPSKIHKLIVADIGPKAYPPHHTEILNALLELHQTALSSRNKANELLSKSIPEPGVRQFLLKNLYWETPGKLGLRANIPVLHKAMNAIGAPLPQTAPFLKPVLFLAGGHSNYILPEDHLSILAQFKNAKIITFPKAGHWLHAEQPKEFLNTTLNFLSA